MLKAGIQAARSGSREVALGIFDQVIELEPDNELAWMWRASVVPTVHERRICLSRVLQINPDNERAQRAVDRLGGPVDVNRGRSSTSPPAAFAPSAPEPETPSARESVLAARDAAAGISTSGDELESFRAGEADERPSGGRSRILTLLFVLSVIAFLLIAALVTYQNVIAPMMVPPTPTLPPATDTPTPDLSTPTERPTADLTQVAFDRALTATSPPTWTRTYTPTWTLTPTFTVTPLPLGFYELVFARVDPQTQISTIYRVRADGTGAIPLTPPDLDAYLPDVSHAEGRVAYVSDVSGSPEIYAIGIDGGEAEPLTEGLEVDAVTGLSWSPDGKALAFSAEVGDRSDIYMLGVGTTSITNLTDVIGTINRDPAWSPDGRVIAFASDEETPGALHIFALKPGSGEVTRLSGGGSSSYAPAWSPDGSRIAFISTRRGDADVFIMGADGSGERMLTVSDSDAEDRTPSWLSNGEWIVFSSNREDGESFNLFALQVSDRQDVRQITSEPGLDIHPSWIAQQD
jgi:Tol biopolymer transport system component